MYLMCICMCVSKPCFQEEGGNASLECAFIRDCSLQMTEQTVSIKMFSRKDSKCTKRQGDSAQVCKRWKH